MGSLQSLDTAALPAPVARTLGVPRLLADYELSAILALAADPRELALLGLMIGTGLRLAEVPRLEIDGLVRRIDGSALLYVPPGRFHFGRLVPLSVGLTEQLVAYLEGRGAGLGDVAPLFVGSSGEPISHMEVAVVALRSMTNAGIDAQAFVGAEGSRLRLFEIFTYSFAERFLHCGGSLEQLGKHLGHRDPKQTRDLESQVALMRMTSHGLGF